MTELLISLVSGAVGGNAAGGLLKKYNLGPIWNSLLGILGGGLGSQLLSMLGVMGSGGQGGLDLASIIGNVASGGIGGGILLAVVGLIKNAMKK